MKFIKLIKSIFTKEFWIEDFPKEYPPECFTCNLEAESCKTCKHCTWLKK